MTIAFTLINIAYLPMAKTLADSFVAHNPDVPFYICLFDDKSGIQDAMFLKYNVYDKNNLAKDEYEEMRARYDNFSIACALKPFFAEALIRDFKPANLIYLDADIMVFDDFKKVLDLLDHQSRSIILTGHQYTIIPSESELSYNQRLRKYGLYNAGFFALKTNETGLQFLDWWKRILFTKCIRDDSKGIYYDQTWLDLVPNYFDNQCFILRDLGYNVAYWNWPERKLSVKDQHLYINNTTPLVFYHFARYNYHNPSALENYATLNNDPVLLDIFADYRDKLKENLIEKYQPFRLPKKTTIYEKLKLSLKYRLGLIIEKI